MSWLQYLAAQRILSPSCVNGSPPHCGGSLPLVPSSHVLGNAVHSIPHPWPVQWHLTNLGPPLCPGLYRCTNQVAGLPQFWRLEIPNQGAGQVGSFRSFWTRLRTNSSGRPLLPFGAPFPIFIVEWLWESWVFLHINLSPPYLVLFDIL